MTLAKELGIVEYPNPAGGCLLTEPRFADRLREHLEHEKRLTAMDTETSEDWSALQNKQYKSHRWTKRGRK